MTYHPLHKLPDLTGFDLDHTEVLGQLVLACIEANPQYQKERLNLWYQMGAEDCKPDKWYPWKKLLNYLYEFGPKSVFLMGREIPNHPLFASPNLNMHKGLESLNHCYHTMVRGGQIGYYEFKHVQGDVRSAHITCATPLPKEFNMGLVTGLCRKYLPTELKYALKVSEDPGFENTGMRPIKATRFLIEW